MLINMSFCTYDIRMQIKGMRHFVSNNNKCDDLFPRYQKPSVSHTDIAMSGSLNFLRAASRKFECGEVVRGY
jgi:hypothetical protein